jgi:hypothetical protein
VPSGLISTLVLAAMLVITTIVSINMRIVVLAGAVLCDVLVAVVVSDTDGVPAAVSSWASRCVPRPGCWAAPYATCLWMRATSFRPRGVALDLDGGSSHGRVPSVVASHEIPGFDVRPRANEVFWGDARSCLLLVDEWPGQGLRPNSACRTSRSISQIHPFGAEWPMGSALSRCVNRQVPSVLTGHRRELKLFS